MQLVGVELKSQRTSGRRPTQYNARPLEPAKTLGLLEQKPQIHFALDIYLSVQQKILREKNRSKRFGNESFSLTNRKKNKRVRGQKVIRK
jgi:hypothetical protein